MPYIPPKLNLLLRPCIQERLQWLTQGNNREDRSRTLTISNTFALSEFSSLFERSCFAGFGSCDILLSLVNERNEVFFVENLCFYIVR